MERKNLAIFTLISIIFAIGTFSCLVSGSLDKPLYSQKDSIQSSNQGNKPLYEKPQERSAIKTAGMPDIVVIHPPYLSMPQMLGVCPINGNRGAPYLKDPGYSWGAKCRGACGQDCPTNRCRTVGDPEAGDFTLKVGGGFCRYPHMIECPSHQGCRDHDNCFDWCASNGETSLVGPCHMKCTYACLVDYGCKDCVVWADLITTLNNAFLTPPEYDKWIQYSDKPVFVATVDMPKESQTRKACDISTCYGMYRTCELPEGQPKANVDKCYEQQQNYWNCNCK